MIHTEGTETTNFTKWNREEISYHIISAIGDDWLTETVHDALILKLEDREAVTPDEFWTIVEATFGAEAEGELDTDDEDQYDRDEAEAHLETAEIDGHGLSDDAKAYIRAEMGQREYVGKQWLWLLVGIASERFPA